MQTPGNKGVKFEEIFQDLKSRQWLLKILQVKLLETNASKYLFSKMTNYVH